MEKINLEEKFGLLSEHWSPRIIENCDGPLVKVAKVNGKLVWHNHAHEGELF